MSRGCWKREKEIYCLELPYPEINVRRRNSRYARLIQDDFASSGSEHTAITQYIAHHFMLDKEYPEVAKALMQISVCEMKHLDILGELIVALGGEPVFGSFSCGGTNYWSGRYINYECELEEILRVNIEGELAAIEQYYEHMNEINDYNIREILHRIIMDEKLHVKILKKLYKRYCS